MNTFTVLILLAVVVGLASCKERSKEERKAFKEWRSTHKKQYRTLVEEVAAMEIILVLIEEIAAHNKLYDQGKVSFTRGLWEFSDMSPEDRAKNLRGMVQPAASKRSVRAASNPPKSFPSGPASLDWSKKKLVGPVRNQGQCGSCWAFSAAGAIEGALRKKNNKANVSPQQFLDCDNVDNACGGGWPTNALGYAQENGVTDLEEYPYVAYKETCDYDESMKVGSISKYYQINTNGNETMLKDIVASVGPVSMALCVQKSFEDYQSGVYSDASCCTSVNHGVLLTGYGTDPKHGDYWIIKNSWGTTWGEKGFARFARNKGNMCNMASFAMYAEV